ncbi:spore germination protein GerPE [Geobacillus sp. FSL K6-0789]|uniref:Protein GerPE required for proper assembly of spore coat mutations lead to super-dormant spore n=1 Tax=Geobacillus stearothermophilus TaxID=1422 RepID=A0A0K9HV17_GEOSE|nr:MULTISPECIES: spore germination protein GerPE [Geobacillus]KAF6511057.1 Protein GerPE required for proper assembly of spore coat mutations lead to super-dormant spore [Geobacillus stearothermophilus]KMY61228.1 spore gernimation protein [Geobacillus stearothermophilus]KMY62417.1 spore gernimation protein [Geobacillus stearothermophilus]KMY64078.1 spore gernimation protein [Geobacillus stearothermophilus]KOR94473.1 spore gernimation protein [Geobacillus stearothermophilus ATCC 12980]
MKRTSIVQALHAETLIISSVLQIGDSERISARTRALAVQRQYELFFEPEGEQTFPIFTKPIPRWSSPPPVASQQTLHESPVISVRSIRVLGISSSAVVHIGSTSIAEGEARIKHIRQLAGPMPSAADI